MPASDLSELTHGGERRAQFVGGIADELLLGPVAVLDPVQHAVHGPREPVDLVSRSRDRNPLVQRVRVNLFHLKPDLLDRGEGPRRHPPNHHTDQSGCQRHANAQQGPSDLHDFTDVLTAATLAPRSGTLRAEDCGQRPDSHGGADGQGRPNHGHGADRDSPADRPVPRSTRHWRPACSPRRARSRWTPGQTAGQPCVAAYPRRPQRYSGPPRSLDPRRCPGCPVW